MSMVGKWRTKLEFYLCECKEMKWNNPVETQAELRILNSTPTLPLNAIFPISIL